MQFFLVTYCMGRTTFTEVSESEFSAAKDIEIKTYAEQGYSACFSERPTQYPDVTETYFQYLSEFEEGEFLFGFTDGRCPGDCPGSCPGDCSPGDDFPG